jgi:pimeloyl-ACP methyl ester carboxylesterase
MAILTLPRLHWGDPDSQKRALLVHGLGSSAQTTWRLSEALAEAGWSATAIDLRGHGYAPRGSTYRFEDFAGDIQHTTPHDGGSWDVVIGHSIGAAAAVLASVADSGWAKKLVLLDPALLLSDERAELVRSGQMYGHDHLTEDEVRRDFPHWHPLDVELRVWSHRTASRFALEHAVIDNPGWSVVDQAKAVTVPTLIIGSDPDVDSMFTGEHAEEILSANPALTAVVIKGAGHSLHRDKPDDTINALLTFIS